METANVRWQSFPLHFVVTTVVSSSINESGNWLMMNGQKFKWNELSPCCSESTASALTAARVELQYQVLPFTVARGAAVDIHE